MTMTKRGTTWFFAMLIGAAVALPAMAQGGPGAGGGPGAQGAGPCTTNCGPGWGGGPGMGPGGRGGPGMGPGMGGGPRHGMGPGMMRYNQRNTAGWSLMTPEERTAHRDKMRSLKTYDECKTVQSSQHALMETRAKEKGVTLPEPRYNVCDRMKDRGILK